MRLHRLLPLAFVLLTACATTIRKEDLDTYGTKTFTVSKDKLFTAAVGALKSMGYEIAVENRERGLIKTGRRLTNIYSSTSSSSSRTTTGPSVTTTTSSTVEFRQYAVEISEQPTGEVQVRVLPRKFYGDMDVTDRPVWRLEDEQARWNEFFRELSDAL